MTKKQSPDERKEFEAIFDEFFAEFTDKKPKPSPPSEGEVPCPKCDGQGSLRNEKKILFLGSYVQIVQCPKCGGSGKIKT
jgi:hypothetical protein